MRKMPKRILISVGIVVVVLGTLYAVALAKAQARLRRAYAALEADGRPMRVADVIPASVPEAENAGPLFVAAAAPLKELTLGIKDLLDRLHSFASRIIDDSIDQEELALFKDYMQQDLVQSSLDLFEQGLQRPSCRFMRDYEKGLWGNLSESRDMRSLLRIRRAKTRLEAGDKAANGSWDTVFMQFRLAEMLRDDPVCWSQISRFRLARKGGAFVQTH